MVGRPSFAAADAYCEGQPGCALLWLPGRNVETRCRRAEKGHLVRRLPFQGFDVKVRAFFGCHVWVA